MDIGVIDLDTSHPEAFHDRLIGLGHRVVAVTGGDTVADPAYTRAYASAHDIPLVVDAPEDLLGHVDAVFVHSVDWRRHVDRVGPFVEAGVPVHLCKPFAGSGAELAQLTAWAEAGAVITGGSALRWAPTVVAQRSRAESARTVFATTYGHVLDYGIHAFAMVQGLMGPGLLAVRSLDAEPRRAQLLWEGGRTAVVDVSPAGDGYGFYATLIDAAGVIHLDATKDDLYGPYLEETCRHLQSGLPFPFAELVAPERAVLAMHASAVDRGAWVGLDDHARLASVSIDSAAFVAEYASRRRTRLGIVAA